MSGPLWRYPRASIQRPSTRSAFTIVVATLAVGLLIAGCDPAQYLATHSPNSLHPTSAGSTTPATGGSGSKATDPTAAATTTPHATRKPARPLPTTAPSTTTTPTPLPSGSGSESAPRQVGFPDGPNTGVPGGTVLSSYTGPCVISADNTVIDSKTVGCTLDVRAAGVIIKNSRINGRVSLDSDAAGSSRWSYTLQDSEVDAGLVQMPAVSDGNMTVLRSEVQGGVTAVRCGEHAVSCTVRDSWLHGQRIPQNADWHLGGFLSNGGTNVLLQHNTIICDAQPTSVDGGCTGDINLFGDFAVVSHVTIENNLLGANTGSAYCTFGGNVSSKPYPRADHVVYRDNVFERGSNGKCAAYGPVTGFNVSGPGNEWTNNTWTDGTQVQPAT